MARPRKRLALLALLAAPIFAATVLGGPATAATRASALSTTASTAQSVPGVPLKPALKEADGCNNRICLKIYWDTKHVNAYAWLRFSGDSFDGHYQLINPRKNGYNSGPNQIYHHSPAFRFPQKPWLLGKWCVIGWKYNGGHNYNKIGEPCVTVSYG
jgi:hypothetical protein